MNVLAKEKDKVSNHKEHDKHTSHFDVCNRDSDRKKGGFNLMLGAVKLMNKY